MGYRHSSAQDDKTCSPLQHQNEGHPDADTCRLTVKVNVRDHFHRRRGVCHNSAETITYVDATGSSEKSVDDEAEDDEAKDGANDYSADLPCA